MQWSRIWQCLTYWHVAPGNVAEIKSAQVIVTQCAELLKNGAPGPGNILIAEHANRLHERLGLPIIAQREILVAKPDLPVLAVVGGTSATAGKPDGDVPYRPATTREVCVAQQKICAEHNWKNVLVVTFPDHLWRACEVYRKLGLNPIPAVMMGNPNIYYHRNARRWQLRSRFRFKYFWEIPARLLSLKQGWI